MEAVGYSATKLAASELATDHFSRCISNTRPPTADAQLKVERMCRTSPNQKNIFAPNFTQDMQISALSNTPCLSRPAKEQHRQEGNTR
jgi:hypothetical protein